MNGERKPLVRLSGEIKRPPFTREGQQEAGDLLRRLQEGERLGMPHAKPMTSIGPRCLELRVRDAGHNWRLICRIDPDAVLLVDVFAKRTQATPKKTIGTCRRRLADYDSKT